MLTGEELQTIALEVALSLPGAERCDYGPDWGAAKVRGKWFIVLIERGGVPIVNLKVDPDEGEALRQRYPDIVPGYHMNKKHWITLQPGRSLDEEHVRELVLESYETVVATLPRLPGRADHQAHGRRERRELDERS